MSLSAWAGVASAVLGIALILIKVWYENTPARKAKKRREANLELHRKIFNHNADAINDWVDRMRGEDS